MNKFLEEIKKNIYFPLMGIKEFGDTYSEDQIRQLAVELEWKGTGSVEDPLIIDGDKQLPQKIMISNSSVFINIVNCQFVSIIVDMCQNISFNKCSFEILGILRSTNIFVNQSYISLLGLAQTSKSSFKKCTISKGFNLNNQSNIFTDCIFIKKAHKMFQQNFNLSKLIIQLPYFIVAYVIIIVCYFFIYNFNSISLGIDWIFILGILLCLIVLYLLLTRNAKHKIIKKER